MDSQIVSSITTFFFDTYRTALEILFLVAAWFKSSVSLNAVFWWLLGLLTLPFIQQVWVRVAHYRMRCQFARKVEGLPADLKLSTLGLFAKTYPKGPIGIRNGELDNILNVLAKAVEIGNGSITARNPWSEADSGWLTHFFSKCRLIREAPLQETLARLLVYEAVTPGRFDHRSIDSLARLNGQDWKVFTTICSFACSISGRMTPVVLDYEDAIYKRVGLGSEALAGLIAVGLITEGGTGDVYTLIMPDQGLHINYFGDQEFVVKPLDTPIRRDYFSGTLIRPHPFDEALSVGVIDLTPVGRMLGFLTPCSKVGSFTEYLRGKWEVYLHRESSTV